jgi:hypothetical protein
MQKELKELNNVPGIVSLYKCGMRLPVRDAGKFDNKVKMD